MVSRQIWAGISASLTVLCIGLSFGWPSHAIPKLESGELIENFTSSDGSWLISTGFLIGLFAFPIASYLFNRIGRRATLLLSAIPYTIGWILLATLYDHKLWIFIARGCLGFSDSMIFVTIPFYLSEISSDRLRGGISSLFSVMYNSGALISYCTGPFVPFQLFPFIPLVVLAVFVSTFVFMPETPHFYVMIKDELRGVKSLQWLRSNDGAQIKDEMKLIQIVVNDNLLTQPTVCQLFTDRINRKAFLIVCTLVTLEQFSGVTVILFYCQKLFASADGVFQPHISAIIFASVFLFGACCASLTVDHFGRKPLALLSCFGCGITLFLQTVYFYLTTTEYNTWLHNYPWLLLALIIPYVFFAVIGLVNIPMVLMGELFPAKFKAVGSVAFGTYLSLAIICVTQFFQYTTDEIGPYFPFIIFTLNCLCGIVFVIYFMPETKNKSLVTIQYELSGQHQRNRKQKNVFSVEDPSINYSL